MKQFKSIGIDVEKALKKHLCNEMALLFDLHFILQILWLKHGVNALKTIGKLVIFQAFEQRIPRPMETAEEAAINIPKATNLPLSKYSILKQEKPKDFIVQWESDNEKPK